MPKLNEMQKLKLSSKVRIAVHPQKIAESSEKRLWFYMKYAAVVFKTLKKPLFQSFLNWMIKRENIEKSMVKNIQVMVFPFQKENGKGVAGKCNSEGEIRIYPKKMNFLQKMMRDCKKERAQIYIKSRAMATLIHELLHFRYLSDEGKVRKLTKKYFNIFTKHQNTKT